MRKILIAVAGVAILSLLGATAAFADGGPHGNFSQAFDGTNAEDGCAGCHRAHTGYASLLIESNEYDLCITCHGGTGGTTNVLGGVLTSGGTLNGGAFVTGMTSKHSVNAGVTTIPDSQMGTPIVSQSDTNPNGTGTMASALHCSSCHDPHGLTVESVEQYRMLRGGPAGDWKNLVASNEATKSYTTVDWKSGTSQFCASCHDVDTTAAGAFATRHPVDASLSGKTTTLPMQNANPGVAVDTLVCMTCHLPHGTTATDTGPWSSAVGTNSYDRIAGVTDDNGASGNSYLLRYDNRGVCQDCHRK